MYIQPERENENALSIPRNYSGNAFRIPAEEPPPPDLPAPEITEPQAPPVEQAPSAPEASLGEESIPTGAFAAEKPQGLRGRFSFIYSLLPLPERGEKKAALCPNGP